MPPPEEGGNFSVYIADQILSGLSFSSERRSFLPIHSYLFPVCSRSIPQARPFQRSLPIRPSHPPLPPLGRPRLRSRAITLPAWSMYHETQLAIYYCVPWQIFCKNHCFPATTSNYLEEAASRGTYEKIACVRCRRRFCVSC